MIEAVHFVSVGVTDQARARDFYRDALGLEVERDLPYGEDRWIFLKIPDARTMIQLEKREDIPPRQTPALVLKATDVDAACQDFASRGVEVLSGPDDAPWEAGTRWAMIRDSEGNTILLQSSGADG